MTTVNYVIAQKGEYFLTHHQVNKDHYYNQNFDIQQDENGLIYIANKEGVIRYDGRQWELITCPAIIYNVQIDKNSNVFLGGKEGIGYLGRNENNQLSYRSLSDTISGAENIFLITYFNDSLFFMNDHSLFVFNDKKEYLGRKDLKNDNAFISMFKMQGKLIIETEGQGLFEFRDMNFHDLGLDIPDQLGVMFASHHPGDSSQYVLGTYSNDIYLYQGDSLQQLDTQDDGYINYSEVLSGVWVQDSLLAIGTLRGGVVFLEMPSGKLKKIVNYHTGLPDNEVYALAKDFDDGLWVAHPYGFTRIAPSLPFRSYENFPGLKGNLMAVTHYENTLYIGTSTGLFRLSEVKDFEEKVVTVRRKVQQAPDQREPQKSTAASKKSKDEDEGFNLLNIFKKKKKAKSSAKSEEKDDGDIGSLINNIFNKKSESKKATYRYVRHVEKELKSIQYKYEPVKNIETKCNQLEMYKDKLIAAGLSGIYEVTGEAGKPITEEPVETIFVDEEYGQIIAHTYHGDVKIYTLKDGEWEEKEALHHLNEDIFQISADKSGYIWLCGKQNVYRAREMLDSMVIDKTIPYENPYGDEIYRFEWQAKNYFITSGGYFLFDPSTEEIVAQDSMIERFGAPDRYFPGSGKNVWVHNNERWFGLGENISSDINLDALGFFKQIRYIYKQPNEDRFWVITSGNELQSFSSFDKSHLNTRTKLFLKEVRDNSGKILPRQDIRVKQSESQLTFEFAHPDYLGIMGIEYQHKLEGLSDEWSSWTSNPQVSYQYLPAGNYRLITRTKNAFGQVVESSPVVLSVIPPYWKRPWFYALEVMFFGSLLFITYLLNRKNHKYVFISRLLTFLTLILIIELIGTIAENNFKTDQSPVIDFFIQVGIAFLVLPVEKRLRKVLASEEQ